MPSNSTDMWNRFGDPAAGGSTLSRPQPSTRKLIVVQVGMKRPGTCSESGLSPGSVQSDEVGNPSAG